MAIRYIDISSPLIQAALSPGESVLWGMKRYLQTEMRFLFMVDNVFMLALLSVDAF